MRLLALLLLVSLFAVVPASARTADDLPSCAVDSVDAPRNGYTILVATFASLDDADSLAASLPGSWIRTTCVRGAVRYGVNFRRFDSRNAAVAGRWALEDLAESVKSAPVRARGQIVRF